MSNPGRNLINVIDTSAVKDACDWYLLQQYIDTPFVFNSEEAAKRSGRTAGSINRQIQRMKQRAPNFNVHTTNDTSSLNAIEGAVGKWADKRDQKVAKAAVVKQGKGAKKDKTVAADGQADDKTVAGGNGTKRKAATGGGRRVKKMKAREEEITDDRTADDQLDAALQIDANGDWTGDGNADDY